MHPSRSASEGVVIVFLGIAFTPKSMSQEADMSLSTALRNLIYCLLAFRSPYPPQHSKHRTHHTPHCRDDRPLIMIGSSSSSSSSRRICGSGNPRTLRQKGHRSSSTGSVHGRSLVLLYFHGLVLAHTVVDAFLILPSRVACPSLPVPSTFLSITPQQQQCNIYSSSSSSDIQGQGGWTR